MVVVNGIHRRIDLPDATDRVLGEEMPLRNHNPPEAGMSTRAPPTTTVTRPEIRARRGLDGLGVVILWHSLSTLPERPQRRLPMRNSVLTIPLSLALAAASLFCGCNSMGGSSRNSGGTGMLQ